MEERIQTFEATDDQGNVYILHVYKKRINVATHDDPNATILGGLKQILTGNGDHVNRKDRGEYEIVQTGQILRSSDPDAP